MAGKAKGAATASVPGLVKDLVDQFSDPLAFYRELIQNSIDAGSNRIDVTLEYDGKTGAARMAVEDDGEGMDERIIDEYFLVLFRSTKEDDLTKIGKFGVGIVSVFSLRPDLVRVHTAKAGESWRLDFPSYKRYEKFRVSAMREGTLVELFKKMGAGEYPKLAEDSLKTVRFWCKHSDTRIYFHDRRAGGRPQLINEPFTLPEGESLRHSEEGTEIVLGFTGEPAPFFGFYNKGLTLKEGRKEHFPGVAVKIKSRYLEHTITRDNVLEDDNFRKAMAIVKRLAEDELPAKLKAELGEAAQEIASRAASGLKPEPRLSERWMSRLRYLKWLLGGMFARWKRSDWPIFPSVTGKAVSLSGIGSALHESGHALYLAKTADKVALALAAKGFPVLVEGPWAAELGGQWLERGITVRDASTTYIMPSVLPGPKLDAGMRAFLKTLSGMDAGTGAKYLGIDMANFDYAGSCITDRIFVTQASPGGLSRADERHTPSLFSLWRARGHALLNADHPFVRNLAAVHERMPGLAAYMCLKVMHLNDGEVPPDQVGRFSNLAEKVEAKLLHAALRLDAPPRAR
ncbi:MAG: ATP-binding protein [Elusimicrobia bacterium]|nr:ATP-binding protein [Elusimicrobiota bacterium]